MRSVILALVLLGGCAKAAAPVSGVVALGECDVAARDDSMCRGFWIAPQWLAVRTDGCEPTETELASFDAAVTYLNGTRADGAAPQDGPPPASHPPVAYLHSKAPIALEVFAPRSLADRCLLRE